MRVSTGMIFNAGNGGIQSRTSDLLKTQQQISSGRRMLTPSDDPVAAARALELQQAQSINNTQGSTRTDAKNSLGLVDNQLGSASDLLTRIHELTVQAGNAALSDQDRQSIATELRSRYQELLGIANSTDGAGRYLFGGYQDGGRPFSGSVENGVLYTGDDGVRSLQVSSSRQLGISASGNDVFMRVKSGNGTFITGTQAAKTANSVKADISQAKVTNTVTNKADWNDSVNSGALELRFWADPAGGAVATQGYSLGNANLATALPLTLTGVNDNNFTISLNGAAAQTVTVAPAVYNSLNGPGGLIPAIQAAVDTALGAPGQATVEADASNHLVITSTTTGPASSVQLQAVGGDSGFSSLVGAAPVTFAKGANSVAGSVFYDLVDTVSGKSLFTNTASATGAGGTYNHAYISGSTINLSGFNAAYTTATGATGFGASVVVSGAPASGDVFSIAKPALDTITVAEKSVAAWHAGAAIDKGAVTNPAAWRQAANSGNLELRFWTDPTGGTSTQGQVVGTTVPVPTAYATPSLNLPLAVTTGVDDQFRMSLNGAGAANVTVASGVYNTSAGLVAAVQAGVDAAFGAGQAVVAMGSNSQLTITSTSLASNAGVALSPVAGNTGLSKLLGPPAPATPLTIVAGSNDQFDLSLDGAAAVTVTVPAATYNTAASLVAAIQGVLPAGASASLDANGHLVVTSATSGVPSNIGLVATGANTGYATLFGAPTGTAGITAGAGTTFYDLVDAKTGLSAFTGTASTTGGAGNTYGHLYVPGQAISLSSVGGQGAPAAAAFDYGAKVTVTGAPISGDTFTIKSSTDGLGNGYFVTAAKQAATLNAGSGIVGTGTVIDQAKWNDPANSKNLEVRFWKDTQSAPPTLYYDLVDVTTEKSLFTNTTSVAGGANGTYTHKFSPGDAVVFDGLNVPVAGPPPTTVTSFGMSVDIDGTPASGDVFTVKSSASQSIFDTLGKLINAMEHGAPAGTMGNNYLSNVVSQTLGNLSQATDGILQVRATVGSGLAELDGLDTAGSNLDLQYQQTLSGLQDLDYSKAITDMMRQQTELQAAQQSFAKISNLSLFNYL
ncbi:MAG TPA: flagellar hook-associated protein FlgL [Rhodocyclaceae bacterium]